MMSGWTQTGGELAKLFSFPSYMEGVTFALKVAGVAEGMDHHPVISVMYKKIAVTTTTHSAGDTITENDLRLAEAVDKIYSGTS